MRTVNSVFRRNRLFFTAGLCGATTARTVLAIGLSACLLAALAPLSGRATQDAAATRKYAVIAAFLYNFFSYVDWPEHESLSQGPLRIGVLGDNPFGAALDALQKRQVEGRAITVQIFEDVADLSPTHILFVPLGASERLPEIRARLAGQPVLTVGESEEFTRNGGVVRIFETDDAQRVGVEINQTAVSACGLKIRSKLLRLATLVQHPLPDTAP